MMNIILIIKKLMIMSSGKNDMDDNVDHGNNNIW